MLRFGSAHQFIIALFRKRVSSDRECCVTIAVIFPAFAIRGRLRASTDKLGVGQSSVAARSPH